MVTHLIGLIVYCSVANPNVMQITGSIQGYHYEKSALILHVGTTDYHGLVYVNENNCQYKD